MARRQYPIKDDHSILALRQGVRTLALEAGFDRSASEELVIVASELASNILKYAAPGSVEIVTEPGDANPSIRIVARDQGPAFRDIATALRDGYDGNGPIDPAKILRRGGIGAGLGAVVRLTDSFELLEHTVGKEITVIRYVQRPRQRRQR